MTLKLRKKKYFPSWLDGRLNAFWALLAICFASLSYPADINAQSAKVRTTHGAWQITCGKPPGSKIERCGAVQDVASEDRPNVGLSVIFLKTIKGNRTQLRVRAPLGVLLPKGLSLNIDNKGVWNVPFVKCAVQGCLAEAFVDEDLEKKLLAGSTAFFIIYDTPDNGIGIPISLEGFQKALASLK